MKKISLPLLTTMLHLTKKSITYWELFGDFVMAEKRRKNYNEILTEIERRRLNNAEKLTDIDKK